jgi:hypothetical protein
MKDLFKSEVMRYRGWALALAGVHLAVAAFMNRLVDLMQQPLLVYRYFAMIYVLLGLLFGLYQMGGYRKPNQWLYLLHRPLSSTRVCLALFSASALLLFVVIVLPLLLTIGGADAGTARTVDLRHYLLPVAAFGIAFACYLAGVFAMLAPTRLAAVALVLPAMAFITEANGFTVLLMLGATIAWLAFAATRTFKPDRSTFASKPLAATATGALFVVGLYVVLLWTVKFGFEFGLMALGTHPLNGPAPMGGYIETTRVKGNELLRAGLGDGRDAATNLLREQVGIAEVFGLGPTLAEFPVRNQLTNIMPLEFDDEIANTRWTFSHDAMLFHGLDLRSRRSQGWLGTQGRITGAPSAALRFDSPPLVIDNKYLVTRDRFYQYEPERGLLHMRAQLPSGEVFASAPQKAGRNVVVLSNRALYFYDAAALSRETALVTPSRRLALPGDLADLGFVNLAELLDGYLVSFVYGRQVQDGGNAARQLSYRVDDDGGAAVLLHERALGADFTPLFRYKAMVLSPLLYTLNRRLQTAFSAGNPLASPPPALAASTTPMSVWISIGLLTVLSLGLAWPRLRQPELGNRQRLAWLFACALIGLPALLACLVMVPRRERMPEASAITPPLAHVS